MINQYIGVAPWILNWWFNSNSFIPISSFSKWIHLLDHGVTHQKYTQKDETKITNWWFQICFMFTSTWGNDPIWLIFFRRVETTNQIRKHLSFNNFNPASFGTFSPFFVVFYIHTRKITSGVNRWSHLLLGQEAARYSSSVAKSLISFACFEAKNTQLCQDFILKLDILPQKRDWDPKGDCT